MNETERSRAVRQSIAIVTGIVLFLYFLLLCYHRELGPTRASEQLFVFGVLLGLCAGVMGTIDVVAHPPKQGGIGIALIIEGAVMIVLTLVAWKGMGRLAFPIEQILP